MSSSSGSAMESKSDILETATDFDDLVIKAIEVIGSSQGSSRNELADFLVRRGLVEARISRARVQKSLYKAVRDGYVYRPGGSLLYRLKLRHKRRRGGANSNSGRRRQGHHRSGLNRRRTGVARRYQSSHHDHRRSSGRGKEEMADFESSESQTTDS